MTDYDPVLTRSTRALVTEVWELVRRGVIDSRSPAADAALDARDAIDPGWDPVEGRPRPDAMFPVTVDRAYLEELRRAAGRSDTPERAQDGT